jgi:hypothetical protein
MNSLIQDFQKPPSLRLAWHRFPGSVHHHCSVRDEISGTMGFGGGATSREAQLKAVFEWIERRSFRQGQSETSSGWAAHTSPDAARRAAELELVERDAILVSWLLKISPLNLGSFSFPAFKTEFPLLQFGKGKGFLILGALVENEKGRMLISTSCSNLDEGLKKLQIDSERAFHLLETNGIGGALGEHHQSFCGSNGGELAWIFSGGSGLSYEELRFTTKVLEAPLWDGSTAFVANAQSTDLQTLFFGSASLRNLNRLRLRKLRSRRGQLNRARHPIL